MTKMERGEKLEKIIHEKGFNNSTLSKATGVPYSTIDSMIKRNLKNASVDSVIKICNVLGIQAESIVNENEQKPKNLYEINSEFTKVPILGEISCGDPLYVEENFAGYRIESTDSLPSGNAYYLKAQGNSMSPTIPQGAYVLIREQEDVENGEIAAVLLSNDHEASLKRVRKSNDTLMLIPDNSEYEPIVVNEKNPCKILGKAVRYTFDL